jgi:hypothetical protein
LDKQLLHYATLLNDQQATDKRWGNEINPVDVAISEMEYTFLSTRVDVRRVKQTIPGCTRNQPATDFSLLHL